VLVVDRVSGLPIAVPSIDEPTRVNFSDITGHWAEVTIKEAVKRGVISGYPEGTFRPNATIIRAEFVTMLMNALKPTSESTTLSFSDTQMIPVWAKNSIVQSVEAGIVSGYEDGSFRPFANIKRMEMAVMIAKAYGMGMAIGDTTGFSDDSEIPDWAKGAVIVIKQLGIVEGRGNNKFVPNETATRAEAATMIMNLLQAKITK
jgi:arabinogalactan endo-1,4-beta-galactosidase